MYTISKDQVASTLAALIRERLAEGEAVHVPGLGTFSVEHQSSQVEEGDNGEIVLHPPRDEVIFQPEN